MSTLTSSSAWLSLQAHQSVIAQYQLRELFAKDPHRFTSFSLKFNDILMDYSKHPMLVRIQLICYWHLLVSKV